MLRSALFGAAAGAASGLLVLGLVGRLAMSAAALLAGHALRWSLGGTIDVLLFGLLMGAGAGLPYGLIRWRLPRASPWTGLAWGAVALLVLLAVPPPAARSAFGGIRHVGLPAVLALFGAVFLLWGLLLEALLRRAQLINATRPTLPTT
jgi:hypothetical protein